MGRPGLTQAEFDVVADRLLAAGERPTVERMRQALGTGSSLTVQRLLYAWWKALGGRLTASSAKLALPDAPEPVATLASQFWEQALAAARQEAEQALASERASLAAARLEADARVAAANQTAESALATASEAAAALSAARDLLEDRQRLVDQQAAQIEDLTRQRDHGLGRLEQAEAEAGRLRERLALLAGEFEAERETRAAHLRSVEDRAHGEVDRARQEARERGKALQAAERAAASRIRALEDDLAQARQAQGEAFRELTAERAARAVLETQMDRLREEFTSALKARGAAPSPPRARRARRAAPKAK